MSNLFPLPEGAWKLTPKPLETGGWAKMMVDAKLTYKGIDWYRAKGGFGEGRTHPREDWIADLPEVSLHVGHYLHGHSSSWATYMRCDLPEDTIFAAMDEEVSRHVGWCELKIAKVADELRGLHLARRRLAEAMAA